MYDRKGGLSILKLLKGARLIARGREAGQLVDHYLLPNGSVLEIVYRAT